jgi:hypothetical protein
MIFVDVPNIKFYENLSSGTRSDMCGQTEQAAVINSVDAFCYLCQHHWYNTF